MTGLVTAGIRRRSLTDFMYAVIRPFAAIRGRTACGSSKAPAKSFMPKKALSIRGRFEAAQAPLRGWGREQGA